MKLIDYSLETIDRAVSEVLKQLQKNKVLTLEGDLGAGKTTLVKALLAELGVMPEEITSPTFTYVNRYKLRDGRWCNHFDLYRLESLDQFLEMGFDEYLNEDNAVSIIEWPGIIQDILGQRDDVSQISIEHADLTSRFLGVK